MTILGQRPNFILLVFRPSAARECVGFGGIFQYQDNMFTPIH